MYSNSLFSIDRNFDLVKNRSEVKITSPGYNPVHCGFLSKPLVFSCKNEFSNVYDMSDKLGGLKTALHAAGAPIFNQGIFSRQYFTGAGYTSFSLNTRMVSSLYEGNVLKLVAELVAILAPRYISEKEMGDTIGNYTGTAFEVGLKTAGNAVGGALGGLGETLSNAGGTWVAGSGMLSPEQQTRNESAIKMDEKSKATGKSATKIITNPGVEIAKGINKLANQTDVATNVFTLSVGGFFECKGMIAKDFSVTLSRELDDRGDPLYADIVLNVETREVLTKNNTNSMYDVANVFKTGYFDSRRVTTSEDTNKKASEQKKTGK